MAEGLRLPFLPAPAPPLTAPLVGLKYDSSVSEAAELAGEEGELNRPFEPNEPRGGEAVGGEEGRKVCMVEWDRREWSC